jgi:acetylglutamate kinase
MTGPTVVQCSAASCSKNPERLTGVVSAMARVAPPRGSTPLVIVHGGGKEIDVAQKKACIEKRQVEGLRITDEATLEVVVAVLAGSVNTALSLP